ncbi:hypothetical protein B0H16DRAFT_1578077 [Mycena metata]|uniref:Uncharacterized protein n=1 Tax=Mycena metata TaxID=1033252 RepID=A0AAD7I529_9AGAR|nr:hypothetical protein B0H16DRAFT_1578077 [Mycena metata]
MLEAALSVGGDLGFGARGIGDAVCVCGLAPYGRSFVLVGRHGPRAFVNWWGFEFSFFGGGGGGGSAASLSTNPSCALSPLPPRTWDACAPPPSISGALVANRGLRLRRVSGAGWMRTLAFPGFARRCAWGFGLPGGRSCVCGTPCATFVRGLAGI